MAANEWKLKKNDKGVKTITAPIASATVIAAGRLVESSAGLIIDGTATGDEIAWTPTGSADGETTIEISEGNDFTLVGTGDAAFTASKRGTPVDLVVNDTVQQIDVGSSATGVLKIQHSNDSGTVGSASNIEVRINKPIV